MKKLRSWINLLTYLIVPLISNIKCITETTLPWSNISYPGMSQNFSANYLLPPSFWNSNQENLTLVFSDDNVAFYFDHQVPRNITWPFKILSAAWGYSKATYGPFGLDPILYFMLRIGDDDDCCDTKLNSYWDSSVEHRNVINCTKSSQDAWSYESFTTISYLVMEVGLLIPRIAKETGNYPGVEVSGWSIFLIITYDIYLGFGRHEEARRFLKAGYTHTLDVPRTRTYWFRDWFLPIYSNYGGHKVLNEFFQLLYLHWNKENGDYQKNLNIGEFVHFWSGAAGEDLTCLATRSFGWTSQDQDKLDAAKATFPNISYAGKNDNLTMSATCFQAPRVWILPCECDLQDSSIRLVFSDDNVAVYFDLGMPHGMAWPFKILSAAWGYSKATYGPFGLDPILYVVLHIGDNDGCYMSKNNSYWDTSLKHRSVIDCTHLSPNEWEDDSITNINYLVEQVGRMIPRVAKKTGNWPGLEVSGWSIYSIITHDIFLGIGRQEEAIRTLPLSKQETENIPRKSTHWFRDWFLPIYSNYGGPKVLNEFFQLLYLHWNKENGDYQKNLNIGEFVHFWSGAAREDLTCLATQSIGWTSQDQHKLDVAKKTFTNISYAGRKDNFSICFQPPLFWKEGWSTHEATLILVFSDDNVAFYFDRKVPQNITWPFKILADAWGYSKATYGPFGQDPILYVALHIGDSDECQTSKTESYWDATFKHRNVITCMKSGRNGWNDDSYENVNYLVQHVGGMVLRAAKETGNWPGWSVSRWSISWIITYDIYLGIGRQEDAKKLLESSNNLTEDVPRKPTYWFRDWFQPIYSTYGGKYVLNRFFALVHLHWESKDNDYGAELNVGEFVHFWSGASGKDVTHLAKQTFGYTCAHALQFLAAKEKYFQINYDDDVNPNDDEHNPISITESDMMTKLPYPKSVVRQAKYGWENHTLLVRRYRDSYITVYTGDGINADTKWPLVLLSEAWKQTLNVYKGPSNYSGQTPNLVLYLHRSSNEGCQAEWEPSKGYRVPVIDCGTKARQSWNIETESSRDQLITACANLIHDLSNENGRIETNDKMHMSQMIVFDLYLRMGRLEDAYRWLKQITKNMKMFYTRSGENFVFNDNLEWNLSVYIHNGGVHVLNNKVLMLLQPQLNANSNDARGYKNKTLNQ